MSPDDRCERCSHKRQKHHSPDSCNVIVDYGQWCSCGNFVEPGTAKKALIARLESELQALKGAK